MCVFTTNTTYIHYRWSSDNTLSTAVCAHDSLAFALPVEIERKCSHSFPLSHTRLAVPIAGARLAVPIAGDLVTVCHVFGQFDLLFADVTIWNFPIQGCFLFPFSFVTSHSDRKSVV